MSESIGEPTPNGLHVYRDEAGGWRWRRTVNGENVAGSGEGYVHKEHAVDMALGEARAHRVSIHLPDGEVIDWQKLPPAERPDEGEPIEQPPPDEWSEQLAEGGEQT